ncbi:hypothetical protein CVT26_000701 [Gymnopilus dilepis]|uniref:Uncharacterized protein n=1 Tax=Gymnopilus dilepis TaxID=231916 RepID=A0A409WB96_9AGAR|nr:hypothetical protein CVT26_000701 [Gymnopilus dilepis]
MDVPHRTPLSPSRSHSPQHLQASHLSLPLHNYLEPSPEHQSAPTALPISQSTATRHSRGALNDPLPRSHPYRRPLPTSQPTVTVTTLAPNINKTGDKLCSCPSCMSSSAAAAGSVRSYANPSPPVQSALPSGSAITMKAISASGDDYKPRLSALKQHKQKQLLHKQACSAKARAEEAYLAHEVEESTILLEVAHQGMKFDYTTGLRAAAAINNTVSAEKEVIQRDIESHELQRQVLYEKLRELESRVVDADFQLTYMQSIGKSIPSHPRLNPTA